MKIWIKCNANLNQRPCYEKILPTYYCFFCTLAVCLMMISKAITWETFLVFGVRRSGLLKMPFNLMRLLCASIQCTVERIITTVYVAKNLWKLWEKPETLDLTAKCQSENLKGQNNSRSVNLEYLLCPMVKYLYYTKGT